MMKTRNIAIPVIFFFVAVLFQGCEKAVVDENNPLLGYWIEPVYSGDAKTITYKKSDGFIKGFGIQFKATGDLVERANSGWCGTPPISYTDNDGTWNQKGDIVKIRVAYWGGFMVRKWKIIENTPAKLTVEVLETKTEEK